MLKPSLKLHWSTGSVRNTNNNNNNDDNNKNINDAGGKSKIKALTNKRPPAALDLSLISNFNTNGVSLGNHDNGRRSSSTHSLPASPKVVSPFRRSEEFKKRPSNGRHLSCPLTTATAVITSSTRIEKYDVKKCRQNETTRRFVRFSQVITEGKSEKSTSLTSSTVSCSKIFERFSADMIGRKSPILPDTDEVRTLASYCLKGG